MDKYKIASTGNSINYLPQYIAEQKGFFSDLGLEVETTIPNPWPVVLDYIDSGEYQAVCGGIWVPSMYTQHNISSYSCFAKISSLCPFKLVARLGDSFSKERNKEFSWKMLEGRTVLIPCDGGASGYIFLVGTLKDKGVDVSKVRFIHDFVDKMLYDGFTKGSLGDFYFTQAAVADRIVSEGLGEVVAQMSTDGIAIPWSIYYSTIETARSDKQLNHRFALGIQRGLDYLLSHEAEEFIDILQMRWPSNDVAVGISTINRFKAEGMWSSSIEIGKDEYEHYGRYQLDAGIIDKLTPYEELVDISVLNFVKDR